jgi:hypothetical protein
VIGIIDDVARQADLLDSIIIPEGTAREIYNLNAPQLVAIDTSPGAAALVAQQAPTALDPNDPSRLRAASAGGATRVKDEVSNDLSGLFLILGGVSLLVGAIGIANVTLVESAPLMFTWVRVPAAITPLSRIRRASAFQGIVLDLVLPPAPLLGCRETSVAAKASNLATIWFPAVRETPSVATSAVMPRTVPRTVRMERAGRASSPAMDSAIRSRNLKCDRSLGSVVMISSFLQS